MQTLRQWLSAEPFTLVMSSGYFSFFAHTGMLSALESEGLAPAELAGSSAGALVGGLWSSGLSTEQIKDLLAGLSRPDFWDPKPGFGLLRGQKFQTLLEENLACSTFDGCRRPLTVSVYDLVRMRTRTLSSGPLAPALRASCSLPLLFQPTWLAGRPLLDGGVADRPGLRGVPRGTRTLFHHIKSRSPWRRKNGSAMRVPKRQNMATLAIDDLPRVGPFALDRGMVALQRAREETLRALNQPYASLVG